MNRITDNMETGTIGELLIQLRLLEYGVQAAQPIIDSGNDLIAIKDDCFRAIQVKSTLRESFAKPKAGRKYHILAIVKLAIHENQLCLDKSQIFLIPKDKVAGISTQIQGLDAFRISPEYVESLFT